MPVDDTDFDTYLRDSIKEVLAQSTNQGEVKLPAATTTQEIKLNIGGQEYTFPDASALNTTLNQTFQQYAEKQRELELKLNEMQGQYVSDDKDTSGQTPDFDPNTYLKTLANDPLAAQKDVLNRLLFDGKSKDPIGEIKQALTSSRETKEQFAVRQFAEMNPYYPGGPQYAAELEAARNKLNVGFTPEGLTAAYHYAVSQGRIPTPNQVQQLLQSQQIQNPTQPQYQGIPQNIPFSGTSYNQPPYMQPQANTRTPIPGRGVASVTPDLNEQVENMSPDQIEALIRRLSAQ